MTPEGMKNIGWTHSFACARFVNNTCGSGGGGILTFSYDGIVIDACSFQDNTALAGAAAYIVRHCSVLTHFVILQCSLRYVFLA